MTQARQKPRSGGTLAHLADLIPEYATKDCKPMLHITKPIHQSQWRPRGRRDPLGPDGQIAKTLRHLYAKSDALPRHADFLTLLDSLDAAEGEQRA